MALSIRLCICVTFKSLKDLTDFTKTEFKRKKIYTV